MSITIFGVRERRDPPAAKQERFRFREIIQTILRNDQLVWIAVIFLLQQIGNGLIVGGLGSTYIFLTFGYEGGLYSLFTMVGMSATAFLMVFYPAISLAADTIHFRSAVAKWVKIPSMERFGYCIARATKESPSSSGRMPILDIPVSTAM